jgi:hypothetical protein
MVEYAQAGQGRMGNIAHPTNPHDFKSLGLCRPT